MSRCSGCCPIWLPNLVERIASFLPSNDVACALILVDKSTAALFRGRPQFSTVRLSQPVPPWAFARRWGAPGAVRSLSLDLRRKLLCLTAASGIVANLDYAMDVVGFIPTAKDKTAVLNAAAASGQAEMCRLLLGRGYPPNRETLCAAAKGGHLEACQTLLDGGVWWDAWSAAGALAGGHTRTADWLLQRRPEGAIGPGDTLQCLGSMVCKALLVAAAKGCDYGVLRSLYQRCTGDQPGAAEALRWLSTPHHWIPALPDLITAAVSSTTPDWRAKVEWLEALGAQLPSLLSSDAARMHSSVRCREAARLPSDADALERLRWLRSRGCSATADAVTAAAVAGNMATLEYLLTEGGIEGDLKEDMLHAVAEVASAGRLHALLRLESYGCRMHLYYLLKAAAEEGHLQVLEWSVEALSAHARDPDFLAAAAWRGHMHVLEWLAARGCPGSPEAFAAAAGGGCEEAVEWLAENGCPMGDDGEPYSCAAKNHDLATLRCLARAHCPWGPTGKVFTHCVAVRLPLAVLRCMAEECRCPLDVRAALRRLAKKSDGGDADVRAWLQEWERRRGQ
ncbi:hypothetical protein GPECTOR_31g387 [Gonium pectorale]|uniref:Uncharacterized protein n=1 Tax=Gonium pectorale TaxID=33097 RepID=A0A150GE21_GONPE|nr:hypothetical protein GPECTOR_31g387 [Gonium pectorale]|eukprot:KXZ48023.1 hypothetical protein GPECTOR_31g387 [Gonium pectorale]